MDKKFQQLKHANLHLKTDLLQQYGLPDLPYPVPAALVQQALTSDGHLPFALLLRGLQERSRDLATCCRCTLRREIDPAEIAEPLELREVIAELAGDLYAFRDWDIGSTAAIKNSMSGSGGSARPGIGFLTINPVSRSAHRSWTAFD